MKDFAYLCRINGSKGGIALYCPSCGEELDFAKVFHFCPYCGKKLLKKEHKKEHKYEKKLKKMPKIKVETVDNYVATVSTAAELADQPALLPALPDENYTVILKLCLEKDQLFIKLTEILRRDSFAVRLAVELIPAVLMYKSKLAEILPVLQVCRATGALFSVVSGNFSLTVAFPKNVLDELSLSEQELIKISPPALWLGENIYFAVGKIVSKGKQGVLILSDHHLYFISDENQKFAYAMIPLKTIVSVDHNERKKLTTLVVKQQGQDSEIFFITSKHQPIVKLQQLLLSVVATQRVRRN